MASSVPVTLVVAPDPMLRTASLTVTCSPGSTAPLCTTPQVSETSCCEAETITGVMISSTLYATSA